MAQFPQVPRVDLARWRWLCALYSIASRLIGKHMVSIWTLPTIYTQELLAQKPPRPSRPLDNPKDRAQWYLLGNSHQTSHAKPEERPIIINPRQSRNAGDCTPPRHGPLRISSAAACCHQRVKVFIYDFFFQLNFFFFFFRNDNSAQQTIQLFNVGFFHGWTVGAQNIQHRHVIEVYGQ